MIIPQTKVLIMFRKLTAKKTKNIAIKLINLPKNSFTYSFSRNSGIKEATSEYCAFITAHAYIKNSDAISYMLKNFNDPHVAGVYSRIVSPSSTDTFGKLSKGTGNNAYKVIRSKEYFLKSDQNRLFNYVFLATFAIVKTNMVKAKTFPFLELPRSEDLDWGYRVINAGKKIVLEPKAITVHYDTDSLQQIANRWLSSLVSAMLILTNKAPSMFKLIVVSNLSFSGFLLKVLIKSKASEKLKYLYYFFMGNCLIIYLGIKKYIIFKQWEGKYLKSKSLIAN